MQHFIAIIAFVFIFSSCKDNSGNNILVFRETAASLEKSSKHISNQTVFLYKSMENNISDPVSMLQASVWQPKAMVIQKLSSQTIDFIDALKSEIKREAGSRYPAKEKVNWENDMSSVNRMFYKNKKGEELYSKLIKYRLAILAVDYRMRSVLEKDTEIISQEFDTDTSKQLVFTKTFFERIPAIAAYTMLNKFENNIRIVENIFAMYCNIHSTGYSDAIHVTSALLSQNSSCLKAGEYLEIKAGVGAFSHKALPKITIAGKNVELNENAIAIYKLKTPLSPGKYFVPVKVEFTNEIGKREVMTKTISYTVFE